MIPIASEVRTCEAASSTTCSPGLQNVSIAARFAIPHVGTQVAAALPSSAATRAQSSFTEASSPTVAQPSSAFRIASHISLGRDRAEIGAEVDHRAQQVPARPRAGVLAAVDHDDAVDEHVLDAARVVVRVVDRRDLVELVVVEDDDVGGVARRGAGRGPRGRSARAGMLVILRIASSRRSVPFSRTWCVR